MGWLATATKRPIAMQTVTATITHPIVLLREPRRGNKDRWSGSGAVVFSGRAGDSSRPARSASAAGPLPAVSIHPAELHVGPRRIRRRRDQPRLTDPRRRAARPPPPPRPASPTPPALRAVAAARPKGQI